MMIIETKKKNLKQNSASKKYRSLWRTSVQQTNPAYSTAFRTCTLQGLSWEIKPTDGQTNLRTRHFSLDKSRILRQLLSFLLYLSTERPTKNNLYISTTQYTATLTATLFLNLSTVQLHNLCISNKSEVIWEKAELLESLFLFTNWQQQFARCMISFST